MDRLSTLLAWLALGLVQPATAQPTGSIPAAQVHRIEVLEDSETGRVYRWNIVSATSPPKPGPPRPEWRDFAHFVEPSLSRISASPDRSTNSSAKGPLFDSDFRTDDKGGEVPAYWEAILPATYTLEFATPFLLHRIDLTPPLRKIGFSDFQASVRGVTEETYHPVTIVEATAARGPTLESGYHWSLRIEPRKVRGVRIDFDKGTLDFPGRVFLKDLDLWGE